MSLASVGRTTFLPLQVSSSSVNIHPIFSAIQVTSYYIAVRILFFDSKGIFL